MNLKSGNLTQGFDNDFILVICMDFFGGTLNRKLQIS